MGVRIALLVAAIGFGSTTGCADGDDTRVDVLFDADGASRARADAIRVRVLDGDGAQVLARTESLADVALPTGVRLVPRGGDASRTFEVTGELLDAAGAPFSRVAARGTFASGQRREIRLRFEDACQDVVCDEALTCRAGGCVDPCLVAARPGGTSVPCRSDGGVDAGPPADDGGRDGGLDAGSDAGPTRVPPIRSLSIAELEASGTEHVRADDELRFDASGSAWLLFVSARVESTGPDHHPDLRYKVDGIVRGSGSVGHAGSSVATGPFLHFDVLQDAETTEVAVELNPRGDATTAARDVEVHALPLGPGADLHVARGGERETIEPGAGWQSFLDAELRPTSAGRYLVLATASAVVPGTTPLGIQLVVGGDAWPRSSGGAVPRASVAAGPQQTVFFARTIAVVGTTPIDVSFEASSPDREGELRHARVVMLRVDSLTSFQSSEDVLEERRAPSGGVIEMSSLEAGATCADRGCLVLQALEVAAAGSRRVSLAGPAGALAFDHSITDDRIWLAYGAFRALRADSPARLSNSVEQGLDPFGVPVTTRVKESVILVLGP